jgi:transcriptional regulator with XRE-family HTH domain
MIGNKIKELRKSKGITQNELATILGLKSQSTIASIENNKNKPSSELLIKIAEYFNVTVDYLISTEERLNIATDALKEISDLASKYTSSDLLNQPKDKKQYIDFMKNQTEAFFMNDEFGEDDKKEFLDTMTEIFFRMKTSKKKNHKK